MHAAATMCSSEGSECIHATMKQLKERLIVTCMLCVTCMPAFHGTMKQVKEVMIVHAAMKQVKEVNEEVRGNSYQPLCVTCMCTYILQSIRQ